MAYSITLSDGTVVNIGDGVILNTYSVPLVGQNAPNYGDDVATAFMRSLENFAYSSDPATNPNIPGSVLLEGQLWYNTTTNELSVYNGSSWDSLLTPASDFSGIDSDIIPSADSTYSIGATGFRWLKVWADDVEFGGDLTASATSTMTTSGAFTADGASTVDLNGTNTLAGATMTGRLDLVTPSGALASLRLAEGTSTSVTTGDVWLETDGVHVIIDGTEQTLAVAGGAGSEVSSFNTRSGDVTSNALDYSDPGLSSGRIDAYPRKDSGAPAQTISGSAGDWTFNNTPNFNGGVSGASAPFTVDSNFLVTNLNADRLDGQEGNYYAVDADVVHNTGVESVAGTKTFSATINADAAVVSGEGLRIRGTSPSPSTNLAFLTFYESDNTTLQGRLGRVDNSSTAITLEGTGTIELIPSALTWGFPALIADSGGVTVQSPIDGATVYADISLAGTGENGALRFLDQGGDLRNAGFNETPTVTVAGIPVVINSTHVGKFLTRTAITATEIRLDGALNNFPTGASFMVHNDNLTNTMTITQNGTTIEWVDGSGAAPITGDRTIAYNGVATIRKKSSSVYQIWGNGIS